MNIKGEQKCVMVIAGDTSGDHHGAKLVQAMREKNGGLFFCGIGGQALKAAGVRLLLDTSALSVIGVTEIFSKLHHFVGGMRRAKSIIRSLNPDLLILIDFPGFNLPFSAIAKRYGVKILYYISPQVWAWRQGRVKKIRRRIDHMAVILPFEEDFFKQHGIPVSYVGHPLLDTYACLIDSSPADETENSRTIGLLPGSRDREIERHLPEMLDAAQILSRRLQGVRFAISLAPSVNRDVFDETLRKHAAGIDYRLISDGVETVFRQCGFAVVCSGTVTLEAALCCVPMVIMYKVSPLTAWVGRALIKGINFIGLVNLIAGKELAPELIQDDATSKKIADTVYHMVQDAAGMKALKRELLEIRDRLGGPGAAERTADIALKMMDR